MRGRSQHGNLPLRMLTVLLFAGGMVLWAWLTARQDDTLTDFVQDYLAAGRVLNGSTIYGPAITEIAENTLGIEGIVNFHPPSSALFFIPLALLPYATAFWLWSALSLVLYLLIFEMTGRAIGISPGTNRLLQALFLYWYPFVYGLAMGQSTIVMGFLLIAAWFCMEREGDVLAGIMVGIACLFKLYPLFLLLFFAVTKFWKALISSSATVLLGFAATLLFVGPDDVMTYFFEIAPEDVLLYGVYPLNYSFTGFVYPLLIDNGYVLAFANSKTAADAVVLLASGVLAVTTLLKGRMVLLQENGATVGYGLACVTMLLVSPITWAHSLIVLLIPLIFLLRRAFLGPGRGLLRALFILVVLFALPDVLIARTLLGHFSPEKIPPAVFILTRASFWGLCVLWLLLFGAGTGKSTSMKLSGNRA